MQVFPCEGQHSEEGSLFVRKYRLASGEKDDNFPLIQDTHYC